MLATLNFLFYFEGKPLLRKKQREIKKMERESDAEDGEKEKNYLSNIICVR